MQIVRFSKIIIDKRINSSDIKVFALCWAALALSAVAVDKSYECAKKLLNIALNKARSECENCVLLEARVLRHFAFMQYDRGNRKKALKYMLLTKAMLFNAIVAILLARNQSIVGFQGGRKLITITKLIKSHDVHCFE